jgi:hypothetical protein
MDQFLFSSSYLSMYFRVRFLASEYLKIARRTVKESKEI